MEHFFALFVIFGRPKDTPKKHDKKKSKKSCRAHAGLMQVVLGRTVGSLNSDWHCPRALAQALAVAGDSGSRLEG